MNREELSHIRDRLIFLTECSATQKPQNIKRKSSSSIKSRSKDGPKEGPKWSMQDFVRRDPSYTTDIEHLVFPGRRRSSQTSTTSSSKTRSRLAEMFALSRHLQQRSVEREFKTRNPLVNRSIDSAIESGRSHPQKQKSSSVVAARLADQGLVLAPPSSSAGRSWAAPEKQSSSSQPVRQGSVAGVSAAGSAGAGFMGTSRPSASSSSVEVDMTSARGPNVSIVHLRNTSDRWDSLSKISPNASKLHKPSRSPKQNVSSITKHQSLGSTASVKYPWENNENGFNYEEPISSKELFITGSCSRELSPVRWCDREVDGVFLGRSGWVQVQQRSLDDCRKSNYKKSSNSGSLQQQHQQRKRVVRLADYHCNSEPGKLSQESNNPEKQRPVYLPVKAQRTKKSIERSPSPPPPPSPPCVQDSSPPSITPIISPPPAFQDKKEKTRSFFNKAPFLPRYNAIDRDVLSPPESPLVTKPPAPQFRKLKPSGKDVPKSRMPQTKSLEDTSACRRTNFIQKYGSSSSSSSSMGFRSLDSCLNRPSMPKLKERSSFDTNEDADEEDNISSSANFNLNAFSPFQTHSSNESVQSRSNKSSTGRSSRSSHYRPQMKRSPVSSDTAKQPSSRSSSSSSVETRRKSPSSSSNQSKRSTSSRQNNVGSSDETKVRRSRSLQLPDKTSSNNNRSPDKQTHSRISPVKGERQQLYRKLASSTEKLRKHGHSNSKSLDVSAASEKELLHEAEIVTDFMAASRSKAAAQALVWQRYTKNKDDRFRENLQKKNTNSFEVYYVGRNGRDRRKILERGVTTPSSNREIYAPAYKMSEEIVQCPQSCDYWPHCAHRENWKVKQQMRASHSYPLHQHTLGRSSDKNSSTSSLMEQISQDIQDGGTIHDTPRSFYRNYPRRSSKMINDRSPEIVYNGRRRNFCRISPNSLDERVRDYSEEHIYEKISPRISPSTSKSRSPSGGRGSSGSSSNSDMWATPSDRTYSKSPKTGKGSSGSTPLDNLCVKDYHDLSRPGSAPTQDNYSCFEVDQRSMSLPKSFLSASYQQGETTLPDGPRRGTESVRSSPGIHRRQLTPETSHTAPVTPLHENNRKSSLGESGRTKATSTPHLLDPSSKDIRNSKENCESYEFLIPSSNVSKRKDFISQRSLPGAESVLKKFRKTFSLRFQKKGSKDSCSSEQGSEVLGDPSEEESPQHIPLHPNFEESKDDNNEHNKHKFGSLVWRSSKDRKKTNKAARNVKCNSGDSGIQIELVGSGCGGAGGDSSESHAGDTDPGGAGDENESPPTVRRRAPASDCGNGEHLKVVQSRPHSELLNQVLIDKFKAELQSRAHRHRHVRRAHSDLGGQRLFQWDPRSSYRRLMSSPNPLRKRPLRMSPSKKPPDAPDGVQLRSYHHRSQLRRSLSQPIDIDKLSPLMRTKTAGLRLAGAGVFSEDEQDCRLGTSEDEMLSDSESSLNSLHERKKSLELAMDENVVILAEAVFDHVAIESEELAFRAGDVIEVLETVNRDWWWGSANGKEGWFPAAFVRLRVSQEDTVEDCLAAMVSGRSVPSSVKRRTSVSLLSNDQVRTSVVRELVHTERDFVKVLQDVVEGYIAECRKRKDMFTKDQIDTIFSNLEEILKFQTAFLKDLESCIDWENPYKSCVGKCFIKHKAGFEMYSDYCNSHPLASATLQELCQFNSYSKFFEACRLMRGLIEIPLNGYLLTPVQRICKYPLQLAELLKYTRGDHPDYSDISEALDTMRSVAVLINERKRRMESLEKIAAWQQRVEGWEGEDLIESSSRLIHQGEVVRVTTGMWTSNITLFLFDHQLVYCKKDILKRNTFVYKGRIDLDTSEVIDVPDGKDVQIGVTVRHSIRIHSCIRDKWLMFCCRSAVEKQQWLKAFAKERRFVAQDKSDGLEFHSTAKQLAKAAARSQRRPPRKPRGGKNSAYLGSALQISAQNSNNAYSLSRKVGTWFTFGVNRKIRYQQRDVS